MTTEPPPLDHATPPPEPPTSATSSTTSSTTSPPRAESTTEGSATGSRRSDEETELWLVKAMTWAGSVTLIIGFGFVYSYANRHGWVTDAGRIAGGTITGVAMLMGSVVARARSYKWSGDSLAAAGSGVLMVTAFAAGRWEMIDANTSFRAAVLAAIPLWGYAVAYRSRLAGSIVAVAVLLPPALLPHVCGPSPQAPAGLFAGYLMAINLVTVAVAVLRPWRLPTALTLIGTGVHLSIWFAAAFAGQTPFAAGWLAAFTVSFLALVLTPVLRTRQSHPSDSPLLVASSLFLTVAAIGIAHSAAPSPAAETASLMAPAIPTGVALLFGAVYLAVKSLLPRPLDLTYRGVIALLAFGCVPLWLPPVGTVVAWAVLGLVLGRLAVEQRSAWAQVAAAVPILLVQTIGLGALAKNVASPDRVPSLLATGTRPVSLGEVFPNLTELVSVADSGLLASANVASLGLASLAVAYLLIGRSIARSWTNSPKESREGTFWAGCLFFVAASNATLAGWVEGVRQIAIQDGGPFLHGGWTLLCVAALSAATLAIWKRTAIRGAMFVGTACAVASTLVVLATSLVRLVLAFQGDLAGITPPFANVAFGLALAASLLFLVASRNGATPLKANAWAIFGMLTVTELCSLAAWIGWTGAALSAFLTILIALAGIGTLIAGLAIGSVDARRVGLFGLLLATGKVHLLDIWNAGGEVRTVAVLLLGGTLLGVAFAYRRFRDRFGDVFNDAEPGQADRTVLE